MQRYILNAKGLSRGAHGLALRHRTVALSRHSFFTAVRMWNWGDIQFARACRQCYSAPDAIVPYTLLHRWWPLGRSLVCSLGCFLWSVEFHITYQNNSKIKDHCFSRISVVSSFVVWSTWFGTLTFCCFGYCVWAANPYFIFHKSTLATRSDGKSWPRCLVFGLMLSYDKYFFV